LLIVHHHFRPGGVRRVIATATPHLVAHWPERIRAVVLATGEAPDSGWLHGFRSRLHGTPVKVLVQPAFGYAAELALDAKTLRRRVIEGIMELLRQTMRDDCLIWAHNLGLGRNLCLARELTFTSHCTGIQLGRSASMTYASSFSLACTAGNLLVSKRFLAGAPLRRRHPRASRPGTRRRTGTDCSGNG
jgi:hypothetical protein